MTKDEIILMADASGLSYYGMGRDRDKFLHYLEAFADLVAAAKPWQGLTPEDLAQIDTDEFWQVGNHMAIAMAVEDKLKERNT